MAIPKRTVITNILVSIALLFQSSADIAGLSSWNETANDFGSGQFNKTTIQDDGLILATKPSPTASWANRTYPKTPTPRYQHAMVYDSMNGVNVIYGGYYSDGPLNDAWAYNMTADNWTNRPRIPDPSEYMGHINGQAMAFDEKNGIIVIFGGFNSWIQSWGHYYYTFMLNCSNNKWQIASTPDDIFGRVYHSMAYSPQIDRTILFGGEKYTGDMYHSGRFVSFNDTWSFDSANKTWTNLTGADAPSPRHSQSMCFDPSTGLMIMFGGRNETNILEDTWTYNPVTNAWIECKPPSHPLPRYGAAMAQDAVDGSVLIFGGEGSGTMYNDTWSYNATQDSWTCIIAGNAPSARCYPAMTYDTRASRIFLFAGREQSRAYRADYWAYDPANESWTMLGTLVSPLPRTEPGFAYDAVNDKGVLFGGGFGGGFTTNDTWTYDASLDLWTEMRPDRSPPIRSNPAMCFDSKRGEIVLFGGTPHQGWINDTWTYNLSRNLWTEQKPAASPLDTGICQMVYDSLRDLVVLFGAGRNQTWIYSPANNSWTNCTKSFTPPDADQAALVYDKACGMVILFSLYPQQTFVFNSSSCNWFWKASNGPLSTWDYITAAYDTSRNGTFIFGYSDDPSEIGLAWLYDLRTDTWADMSRPVAPPPTGGAMYFDSLRKIAVFAGYGVRELWIFGLTDRYESGTYVSRPENLGGRAFFGLARIDATVPARTDLEVQVRAGWNEADLQSNPFVGPDGTGGSYFRAGEQRIPPTLNGNEWIQYWARLTTGNPASTPKIRSVTIDYNLRQSIAILSPKSADNWTEDQNISWYASDLDNDTLAFDLFLENGTSSVPLVSNLTNDTRNWQWNTSSAPNGTYRIRIIARDDNPAIPLSVNATSGNFTIYHPLPPPIDHLPEIALVSPPNNSYIDSLTVKFSWRGSDPEGDALSYNLNLERPGLDPYDPGPYFTKEESLEIGDLLDNRTYNWTVTASEDRSPENAVVSEKWSFTVRLPPANRPIRITSTPVTTAWTNQLYLYNLSTADEDADIPSFVLLQHPPNMTLNSSTGQLHWIPGPADVGNHTIAIRASDGRGSLAYQTFILLVFETPVPPVRPTCKITSPANGSTISGKFQIRGIASAGSSPINLVFVRIDGSGWKPATGLESWTFPVNASSLTEGRHTIEARSFDGTLYSETANVTINIQKPVASVTVEPFPFYIIGVIIAVVVGISLYLIVRRRNGAGGIPKP